MRFSLADEWGRRQCLQGFSHPNSDLYSHALPDNKAHRHILLLTTTYVVIATGLGGRGARLLSHSTTLSYRLTQIAK